MSDISNPDDSEYDYIVKAVDIAEKRHPEKYENTSIRMVLVQLDGIVPDVIIQELEGITVVVSSEEIEFVDGSEKVELNAIVKLKIPQDDKDDFVDNWLRNKTGRIVAFQDTDQM